MDKLHMVGKSQNIVTQKKIKQAILDNKNTFFYD